MTAGHRGVGWFGNSASGDGRKHFQAAQKVVATGTFRWQTLGDRVRQSLGARAKIP